VGVILSLADAWKEIAARAVRARAVAVGADFDGTLVPLAGRPSEVELPAASRAALERLAAARGVTLVVAGGRALADLKARTDVAGALYIGSHGLETFMPGRPYRLDCGTADLDAVRAAIRAVEAAVRGVAGAWIEDKGVTAALHYRQTPAGVLPRVLEAARLALAPFCDVVRILDGRCALEIVPAARGIGKGHAFRRVLAEAGVPADAMVWYFGDDATDEDVFTGLPPDAVSVYVGPRMGPSVARYDVKSPGEAVAALARLADLRK
jgi:trehalose 6-phosphate phosphatase